MTSPIQIEYRPDVDGLRAIAVLAVVGFHAFPAAVTGGFVGVDIFFVISGFLISSIILQGLERETFTLADFYARRVRRIFPALATMLLVCMIFGWWVLFSDEYRKLGKHTAAGAGFLSNFILLREGGYFDTAAEAKPLLHLWSLGIEEQYYLIWPILLSLAWRARKWVLQIIACLCLLSFALNIYLTSVRPMAAFYLPQSRGWELALGSMLAFVMVSRRSIKEYVVHSCRIHLRARREVMKGIVNTASVAGAGLIVASVMLLDKTSAFPGWLALMPTMGAFLLILSGPNAWVNVKLLSRRWLVSLGLISYPVYLWHWPILYFARVVEGGEPSPFVKIALVSLSGFLAYATYHYIELPIRKRRASWLSYPLSLCLIMAIPTALGTLAYFNAIPMRYPAEWQLISEARSDRYSPRSWDAKEQRLTPSYLGDSRNPEILFFGDSHMENYYPRIKRLMDSGRTREKGVAFATAGGCPPLPGVERRDIPYMIGCAEFFVQTIEYIKRMRFRKIVLDAYWDKYLIGNFDSRADDPVLYRSGDSSHSPIHIGSKESNAVFNRLESELRSAVQPDAQIFILLPNPASSAFDPTQMLKDFPRINGPLAKPPPASIDTQALEAFLAPIKKSLYLVSTNLGAVLIDPVPSICAETSCSAFRGGRPINTDRDHLSRYYVLNYASYLDQVFSFEH